MMASFDLEVFSVDYDYDGRIGSYMRAKINKEVYHHFIEYTKHIDPAMAQSMLYSKFMRLLIGE